MDIWRQNNIISFGLGMSGTRELLGMIEDIEIVGGNKDRRYRLK